MVETAAFITVNTDAGYFPLQRVGSYAYWIKGGGLHLHGSGIFKEKCHSSTDAEFKAVINALHVLKKSNHPPIIGFIFNRDNIHVTSGKKGTKLQRKLSAELNYFRKDAIKRLGDRKFTLLTSKSKSYAQFRHVKAHSDTDDKRSWVNRWADEQCKLRLQEWLTEHRNKQNKSIC